MLILKGIEVYRNDKRILKNINLSFEEGKFYTIIGPSGAGKTTLGCVIKGFLQPSSGEIIYPRGNVKKLQERMGFLFQFPERMFFCESVYDEIAYGIRNFSLPNEKERVEEIVSLLSIPPHILNLPPYKLSCGEKRLIALASVLSFEPDWLILDEPFSALDWENIKKLKEILYILKEKKTIILITHDLSPSLDLTDEIIVMKDGSVILTGTPETIPWKIVEESGVELPIVPYFILNLERYGIRIPRKTKKIKELVEEIKQIIEKST